EEVMLVAVCQAPFGDPGENGKGQHEKRLFLIAGVVVVVLVVVVVAVVVVVVGVVVNVGAKPLVGLRNPIFRGNSMVSAKGYQQVTVCFVVVAGAVVVIV
ncbi:unnamed protein product, partial [Polarella glacialis]